VGVILDRRGGILRSNYAQVFRARLPELSRIFPNLRRIFIQTTYWPVAVWILSGTWERYWMQMSLESADILRDWQDLSKHGYVPDRIQ
jgi:hypothetical protein